MKRSLSDIACTAMKRRFIFSALLVALIPARCGYAAADGAIPLVRPEIVRTVPHDPSAFTQGLVYASGKLYETTGLIGRSSLRRIDAQSGTIECMVPLKHIFAEGLALKEGRLVVLCLHSQRAHVFSQQDFAPLAVLEYRGEGWGLASDGDTYYMSNGSDTLFQRNGNFDILRAVSVRCAGRPVDRLNELEYVEGKIYANVWFSNSIFVIDSASGTVTGIIDCTPLVRAAGARGREDVLNGIAYDPAARTFYITGKNWPLIFEVRIPEIR